ncbi:hypothetical protein LIA77_03484 [Sarocladium implicatum]|jgi:hypothetical protein|nr:hypothetical protein LIA77_03484 [Sarocladium implicatum]
MSEYDKKLEKLKLLERAIEAREMDLRRDRELLSRQVAEAERLSTEAQRAHRDGSVRGRDQWYRLVRDMEKEIAISEEEIDRTTKKIDILFAEYQELKAWIAERDAQDPSG